jgi:hypothetical protein
MKPRYRKILVITGLLSVLSFLLVGVLLFLGLRSGTTGVDNPPQKDTDSLTIIVLVSMFTSLGSAIAFVSTLILSWTKERRERELFAIDAERKKLENEKLVLELEQMWKSRE